MARKRTDNSMDDDDGFESLLNRGWDEIPEEKRLPAGVWELKGRSISFRPGKDGKSPSFNLGYNPVRPIDVDDDALEEMGDYDASQNVIYTQFFIETMADVRRVRDHLLMHSGFVMPEGNIKENLDNKKLGKAFRGTRVHAAIKPETFTDGAGNIRHKDAAGGFTKIEY